ncbi:glycosyltransferase [Aerococcus urinaeequi]|uniref:glycosyltransferase n=1 Tax=Aerococcus urinaeequi TaxID=51665 RepID=UPI000845D290|nr:glycosyltransferase [Aerococcus urinaeequi]
MEVSVIMSEYSTEYKILKAAILSIINQTYRDFEFIIVNDGDNNQLRELVKEIDDNRVKLIENKYNIGLAKSLNKAIDYSSGKYLVRMDTDDIAHPKRIEKQLSFIKENYKYSVIGTSVNILTESNEIIPKISKGEIDANKLMNRVAPVHPSVIMKKKDILEVGKYETKNVDRCEDFVLWAKLLLSGKRIYIMDDVLLDYRVTINDYKKRKLSTRKDEIYNRIKYYSKFQASFGQYVSIFKSMIAGIIPYRVMAWYHRKN